MRDIRVATVQFQLFSNGVSVDDEIRTGNAMVLDPHGKFIAEARALGDETRRVRFGE